MTPDQLAQCTSETITKMQAFEMIEPSTEVLLRGVLNGLALILMAVQEGIGVEDLDGPKTIARWGLPDDKD